MTEHEFLSRAHTLRPLYFVADPGRIAFGTSEHLLGTAPDWASIGPLLEIALLDRILRDQENRAARRIAMQPRGIGGLSLKGI